MIPILEILTYVLRGAADAERLRASDGRGVVRKAGVELPEPVLAQVEETPQRHAAVRTMAKPNVHASQLKGFFRTKPTAAGSWSMEPPLPSSFCGETVRMRKVPVLALTVDTLAPAIPAGLNHRDVGSEARAV